MISSIVGRFIFTIQSCHPCATCSATSCAAAATALSTAPTALSTAPTASATVLAPARFAFSPGTLRAGRSLSGDSKFRGTGYLFSVWFLDEKMEVFGRQRIGDDAEPEKGLKLAHESDGETVRWGQS